MAVLVANGLTGVLSGAAVFWFQCGSRALWQRLGSDTRATRPDIDRERRNSRTRRVGAAIRPQRGDGAPARLEGTGTSLQMIRPQFGKFPPLLQDKPALRLLSRGSEAGK